jgi:CARDB
LIPVSRTTTLWVLPVIALVCVPASVGSTAKKKRWPDLVVTKIELKQLPGAPPYVVEDETGHTPGFAAYVTIRNVGKGNAKGSSVGLDFSKIGNDRVRGLARHLPPMRPKATHVLKFAVDLDFKRKPPIGLLLVKATADISKAVQETDENNNSLHRHGFLPVIAHQWKATDFLVHSDLNDLAFPGAVAGSATRAGCISCSDVLRFRFSTFDEASKHFDYVPTGPVNADFSYAYTPLSCQGSATDNATKDAWPGSFWLDSELDKYNATVEVRDVEPPPARAVIYCMGQPSLQLEWAWHNLETFVGDGVVPDVPSPYDTRLTGHTERNIGSNTTTWQWTFKADVPGA